MKNYKDEYLIQIVNFVNAYYEEHWNTPTVREIADGIGKSKSLVGEYLIYLRDKGFIDYTGKRDITTTHISKMRQESTQVPVIGEIKCGLPNIAEEDILDIVQMPNYIFGSGKMFLLVASGDSMIEAGINDGDYVLCLQQSKAEPGQIVVALVNEEETTLKRYYPDDDKKHIHLHPENKDMDDIVVDSKKCIIQGVATKVIKNIY